jgi:putative aldouronate transport system permease protein
VGRRGQHRAQHAGQRRRGEQPHALAGGSKQQFLANKSLFLRSSIFQASGRRAGWTSIIYLASINGVSPELYEAAMIDGADRFQRMIHVLRCHAPLHHRHSASAGDRQYDERGLDQIFNMYNPTVQSVWDILVRTSTASRSKTSGDLRLSTPGRPVQIGHQLRFAVSVDRVAKMLGEEGLF